MLLSGFSTQTAGAQNRFSSFLHPDVDIYAGTVEEVDPGLKEPRFMVGDEVIGTWEEFAKGGLAGVFCLLARAVKSHFSGTNCSSNNINPVPHVVDVYITCFLYAFACLLAVSL